MDNWYVVTDDEGPWLVEGTPGPDDEVLVGPVSQEEAEVALNRALNGFDGRLPAGQREAIAADTSATWPGLFW